MKILYISAWFPFPPDNGARIRTYNLLKELGKRHEVYLISLLQDDSDPEYLGDLGENCRVVSLHPSRWFDPGRLRSVLGFLSRNPRFVSDTYDPEVENAVRVSVDKLRPELIIANTIFVADYIRDITRIPTILDEHNFEAGVVAGSVDLEPNPLKRLRLRLAASKFARWEVRVCSRFDAVAMVSEEDRMLLAANGGSVEHTYIIPNGADVVHYADIDRKPEPGYLLFNGSVNYGPNADAVEYFGKSIMPNIIQTYPESTLHVTGGYDKILHNSIAQTPGIKMLGYIADIRDVLSKADICLVPLLNGGGSRLKILEAMAAGIPVVSTGVGAEGLGVENGRHILIADQPLDFAEAVIRLMRDAGLRENLTMNAKNLVLSEYDWRVIGEKLNRMAETVVGSRYTAGKRV